MKTVSQNTVALGCLVLGFVLILILFLESRNDPSLRIAALVAGTGYVSLLGAVGSTILTGKDLTKPDPNDLPPGSTQRQSTETSVAIAPVAPTIEVASKV